MAVNNQANNKESFEKKKKVNKKTSLYCFVRSHFALTAWALREALLPPSERR